MARKRSKKRKPQIGSKEMSLWLRALGQKTKPSGKQYSRKKIKRQPLDY